MRNNTITLGAEYGIYGTNSAYPIMYVYGDSAANTVTDNAGHETYWHTAYPTISGGHNNFSTADDTIFYFASYTPNSLTATGNYWGGGAPDTARSGYSGPISVYSINGSFTLTVNSWDNNVNDLDPEQLLQNALGLEANDPNEAVKLFKTITEEYSASTSAPIALERLFIHYRSTVEAGPVREEGIEFFRNYCLDIKADRNKAESLKWKAHRTSLWALAAQHNYDDAIRGFEEIIMNPSTVADSIFALIDVGTLHLEAEEWAKQDTGKKVDRAHYGRYPEIAPVSFTAHRAKTDTLLALLGKAPRGGRALIPTAYYLSQNYPNPFNSTTRIVYGLPEATDVKVKIYDVMGREVMSLVNEKQIAGNYTLMWNGRNNSGIPVASGVYFTRIETPNFVQVKKMTLLK